MRCSRCDAEAAPAQKFCAECGARLGPACPGCGAPVPGDRRFCGQCGTPLPAPAASPPDAAESGPLGYPGPLQPARPDASPPLGDPGPAADAVRRPATVLRADLRPALAVFAGRDPEEARGRLDAVRDRLLEAVHRYEGTLGRAAEGGLTAVFGAPRAHEDHALRACYAALRMQAAVRRLAEAARREGAPPMAIRIGIASGDVPVRPAGDAPGAGRLPEGDTAYLAARMEDAALPGSTVLADATLRLVEGYVETRALGPIRADGVAEPVEAHELLGPGPARTRLEAAAARGLTPFVGRIAELEQLRAASARARRGHGQVVAVIGDPGVGKSRLLREFADAAEAEGWRRLEWRALAHGRHTPYRPVAELLRAYFAIGDVEDAGEAAARVRARLAAVDRALEAAAAPLLALLGLPARDPGWDALDAAGRRLRTQDAVRGVLRGESRIQPVLVIAEDLQWVDSETQALLDALVDGLTAGPILLVPSYRPEYRHGWASRSGYDQIRLGALGAAGAVALLDALLGPDPALASAKRTLAELTDGNPLFLEECARSLVETGVLAGSRGTYRLARALPAVPVPATVQAVLAARIDRLPAPARRVLETAAVIGKDVPLSLLEAVLEWPPAAVREAVAQLTAAELVYERGLFPEPELTFAHMLTHDVAYAGLGGEDRRELHARTVGAIERLYPDRLGEHVERLAEHAVKGAQWDRALVYLREAAGRALLRSANREALALLDEALAVLDRLPRDAAHAEHAADFHLMRRNARYVLGESAAALEAARQAELHAARLGDRRRLAQTWAYLAQHLRHLGQHAEAIRSGQRALAAAEAPADDTIRATAGLALGQAHQAVGDFPRAIEALVTTVPGSLEGALRRIVWIDSRAFLAWTLAETGAFEEARSAADEAMHLAEELGYAYARAVARMGRGALLLLWGRPAEAVPVLEESVAIIRAGDVGHPLAWAATFLGSAYALAGRPAEALPLLEEAVAVAERRGIAAHHAWRLGALADGHALAGQLDRAVTTAEAALARAQRLKERAVEAAVLHGLAVMAAARPAEQDAAAAQFRHALALADSLGMRPLAARCHLGLGAVLRSQGHPDGKAHLAIAHEMLRAMDVRHWLEHAAAALAAEPSRVTQ